jgi:hypothetical protein
MLAIRFAVEKSYVPLLFHRNRPKGPWSYIRQAKFDYSTSISILFLHLKSILVNKISCSLNYQVYYDASFNFFSYNETLDAKSLHLFTQ